MADIVFTSKIDFWIAFMLWGGSFLMIAVPFWQWKKSENGSLANSIFLAFIFLPLIALMLMPFFGTKYTLSDDQILIDNGFSTQRIKLTDITYIAPTRNMISAPALSLDRLEIDYKNKKVLISPKDKLLFYQEIRARNPNIVIVK
ncbi:PH domain-containing protein [Psychrobacter sp. APC 3426]|uniref:PH domain-containing protein n=1 Tax=Psychrobacter sp. APC 3426 TaxID=3035177 RepID=UPI0025B5FD8E|nr:PH domain-containing protein [Psychrobacter sp. APC 3426]MDN3398593.1 PH domain-containing protein [Psychrobacter sp. APC 3426]